MNPVPNTIDIIDSLLQLDSTQPLLAVRHQRDKVVASTQACYEQFFDASERASTQLGLSLRERLQIAALTAQATPSSVLFDHYRAVAAEHGITLNENPLHPSLATFVQTLAIKPIDSDKAMLLSLKAAGMSEAAIVSAAQLLSFVSYQARVVSGLNAMQSYPLAKVQGAPSEPLPVATKLLPSIAAPALGSVYSIAGFTNAPLDWRAWLATVKPDAASPVQLEVLKESHPKAMTSDYYLFLIHQPEVLRQRSVAFNAIMYAPGGLSRAERELASTVVSRINGCVYCASVHAQRFEQMAKRNDAIVQVFENPENVSTNPRELAISDFSIALTLSSDQITANHLSPLYAAGLSDIEVLDCLHAIAIFAWANRLMLNLGEPVVNG